MQIAVILSNIEQMNDVFGDFNVVDLASPYTYLSFVVE